VAVLANSLSDVIPQILAMGLKVLREQAIMPRLVNTDLSAEAREKGDTITVPKSVAQAVRNVVPDQTATNVNTTPTKATVTLNRWRESVFMMSDKDLGSIANGVIPRQAEEAVKALANDVDSWILQQLYQKTYHYAGTAGTTPFAGVAPVTTLAAFKSVRTKLVKSLVPMDGNLSVVLDPDAEANALIMSPFLKADERGDQGAIIAANIGRKLGFNWYVDQNVQSHTAGGIVTAAGTAKHPTVAVAISATALATAITAALQSTTNIGELHVGDIFTIENNTGQQFVVTAAVSTTTIAAATTITIAFQPPLTVRASTTNTITFLGTRGTAYVNNVMFHRDAFYFASRPLLATSEAGLGSIFQSAIDPISGLALRLEVSRQNKMNTWAFDILYGGKALRPELAGRILG